jgi:predicted glycoside hydrolase/deacetylase ChbG (UPF0249 family)
VDAMPEGNWEFVCHPGYNDADLHRVNTRLRSSRETELKVLTSQTSAEMLVARGIDRITFADL